MTWPAVTGTSEIAGITELVAPWLHVEDIRRPAMLIDLPAGPYEFGAVVKWREGMPETGTGARVALLVAAEEALAAVEAAGWLLSEYPAMHFSGSIDRAVVTLAGEVVTPPVQHSIGLRVEFAVIRP